jgi:hypothetical protein
MQQALHSGLVWLERVMPNRGHQLARPWEDMRCLLQSCPLLGKPLPAQYLCTLGSCRLGHRNITLEVCERSTAYSEYSNLMPHSTILMRYHLVLILHNLPYYMQQFARSKPGSRFWAIRSSRKYRCPNEPIFELTSLTAFGA